MGNQSARIGPTWRKPPTVFEEVLPIDASAPELRSDRLSVDLAPWMVVPVCLVLGPRRVHPRSIRLANERGVRLIGRRNGHARVTQEDKAHRVRCVPIRMVKQRIVGIDDVPPLGNNAVRDNVPMKKRVVLLTEHTRTIRSGVTLGCRQVGMTEDTELVIVALQEGVPQDRMSVVSLGKK